MLPEGLKSLVSPKRRKRSKVIVHVSISCSAAALPFPSAILLHHVTFNLLKIVGKFPGVLALLHIIFSEEKSETSEGYLDGTFSNPVGLAAGFDKNALLIDELSAFGFGFIEIGNAAP